MSANDLRGKPRGPKICVVGCRPTIYAESRVDQNMRGFGMSAKYNLDPDRNEAVKKIIAKNPHRADMAGCDGWDEKLEEERKQEQRDLEWKIEVKKLRKERETPCQKLDKALKKLAETSSELQRLRKVHEETSASIERASKKLAELKETVRVNQNLVAASYKQLADIPGTITT